MLQMKSEPNWASGFNVRLKETLFESVAIICTGLLYDEYFYEVPRIGHQFSRLVGWLVLGLTALLRQYFSLYRAISQREGEMGEKGYMRVNMIIKPHPHPLQAQQAPALL